ncbi:hypothetical protein BZL30_6347 [Mycobacterium kansasii]|uniref:Uncharacterized protein n=1 Tax=Mycobacterium kansasii TaxID=1768 RepID=A0A1V3WU57_MYCKA|nr:hypothetical protein BZL30_6347 [Mycobacterium kansasii]
MATNDCVRKTTSELVEFLPRRQPQHADRKRCRSRRKLPLVQRMLYEAALIASQINSYQLRIN